MWPVCTGTYDVQSVNGSAIAGGLKLSCTFADGSQAQSCILTVCKMENDIIVEGSCINTTITRDPQFLTSSGQLTNLQPGLYAISEVAEVESDGIVTVLRSTGEALQFMITEPPPTTTSTTPGYSLNSETMIVNKVFLLLQNLHQLVEFQVLQNLITLDL